ncbi:MAG TPA: tetratricopeptide repeat protein, partial [Hyphomicrobiaceae bacterium]|nr:tetratricopeptide repeat protein [Hyphomicrobiaceae bacterium]
MRKMIFLAACLPFGALATPVTADEKPPCTSSNPDHKLEACTALIESGRETGLALAAAYRNRAAGHAAKKAFDQAIADYSKAIELNPKDVAAYNGRAAVYTSKGDYEHAVADATKAVELAPKRAVKPAASTAAAGSKPAAGTAVSKPAATMAVWAPVPSAKKAPPKPAAPRAANASATSGNSPPLTNAAQPLATPAVGHGNAQRGAPATSSTISYGPHTGQGPHAAGHTATSPTATQATGHGANSG